LQSGHLRATDIEGVMKITKLAEHNQDINKFTMAGALCDDDIPRRSAYGKGSGFGCCAFWHTASV
jgi:hypothetical protein